MRRKLLHLIALLVSFVIGICAQVAWLSSPSFSSQHEPVRSSTKISPDFDASGCYYPIEQPLWSFGGIERLDIIAADYQLNVLDNSVRRIPITPEGYFMAGDSYKTLSLSISNGLISLDTESRWGISYQFTGEISEGHFPIRVYSGYVNGRTVMLKGQLTKKLLGWKVAESEISFTRVFGE
jgi:hypothetical protein